MHLPRRESDRGYRMGYAFTVCIHVGRRALVRGLVERLGATVRDYAGHDECFIVHYGPQLAYGLPASVQGESDVRHPGASPYVKAWPACLCGPQKHGGDTSTPVESGVVQLD